MGIDVIKLGGDAPAPDTPAKLDELAKVSFSDYRTAEPPLSIWMMRGELAKPAFPWWSYDAQIDGDIHALHERWSVSSPQNLFDALFLSQLKKFAGLDFCVILTGAIKSEGWSKLGDAEKDLFERGQGCVYRLEGAYNGRLTINWVPFYQRQSVVRNPSFSSLWKLFQAAKGDDAANSLCFLSLKNLRDLPAIAQLLIKSNGDRSALLADMVNFFGLYTSPMRDQYAPAAVVYSKEADLTKTFAGFQSGFAETLAAAQKELAADPSPRTAIRILSRHIAL